MLRDEDVFVRYLHPRFINTDKTSGEVSISSEAFKPHSVSNSVSVEVEFLLNQSGLSAANRMSATGREEFGAVTLDFPSVKQQGADAIYDPLDENHQFGPNPFHALITGFEGLSRSQKKKLHQRLKSAAIISIMPGALTS